MTRAVIVDDSGMSRTILRRCLEIAGGYDWEYVEACDGEAALGVLRAGDLLVTDLNMPRMTGLELVRRVRSSPKLADVGVLVVSSGADVEARKILEGFGAKVLSKPVTPPQIVAALAEVARDQEGS